MFLKEFWMQRQLIQRAMLCRVWKTQFGSQRKLPLRTNPAVRNGLTLEYLSQLPALLPVVNAVPRGPKPLESGACLTKAGDTRQDFGDTDPGIHPISLFLGLMWHEPPHSIPLSQWTNPSTLPSLPWQTEPWAKVSHPSLFLLGISNELMRKANNIPAVISTIDFQFPRLWEMCHPFMGVCCDSPRNLSYSYHTWSHFPSRSQGPLVFPADPVCLALCFFSHLSLDLFGTCVGFLTVTK